MTNQIHLQPIEPYRDAVAGDHKATNRTAKKKIVYSEKSFSEANILDAIQYAREQMNDGEARALYESHALARGRSARSLAMYDYLISPTIRKIDATKYTGVVGETIRIRAVDDFMVVTVGVLIANAYGQVIERGGAVPQITQDQWLYRITAWNEYIPGCSIIVSAHDVAGNTTSLTLQL